MDELPGILARDFGIRPQGKSAPMAASKAASAGSFRSSSAGSSWNMPRSGPNPTSAGDSFLGDDGFGMWGSRSQPAYDDLFGGPPSYSSASSSPSAFDSLFEGYKVSGTKSSSLPMNAKPVHVDDIFDGFPGSKISSVKHVDVFSSFSPGFNHVSTPPYGDLLENLGKPMPEPKSAKKEDLTGFDELIPGFGGNSPPNKREPPGTKQKPSVSSAKPTTCVAEDPFVVLETASTSTNSAPALFVDPLEHINRPLSSKGKKVNASSISTVAFVEINSFDGFSKLVPSSTMDINETEKEKSFVNDFHKASLEHQFSGGGQAQRSSVDAFESIFPEMHPTKSSAAATAAREKQQTPENDLESFFSMGARASSAPKQRTSPETTFNVKAHKMGGRGGIKRTSSGFTSTIRKASSTTNIADDLSFIFGGPPSSGEFQEIEGESEERRRARLDRHRRTLDRAAKALAEKNERDMQIQQEQAERHRISEALDIEIKHWAAGKEGNLRALLSSLQYVLWPECGWQPVSLTDLITAAAVKKVHRKATLCIHPDKMQQKGATLQQKYIAEEVFDILKEAWNKFNSEELR